MRTYLILILVLISHVLPAQRRHYTVRPVSLPKSASTIQMVEDKGSLLTAEEYERLNSKLILYKEVTGYEIAVVTIPSLTFPATGVFTSIEEAALQYFNKLGVGNKYRNDGVLIFVSREERLVRIATGSGLEKRLTNAECTQIVNKK